MKHRGKIRWSSMFQMITFLTLSSFLFAGCSGSSSSGSSASTTTTTTSSVDEVGGTGFTNSTTGTGTALKVAEQVSVVDAQTTASGKPRSGKGKALAINFSHVRAASALPAGSDYNTDPTSVWVSERSAEAFDQVNEILCMVGQTKYVDMVNAGAYIAQIDGSKCKSERDDASKASDEAQSSESGESEGANVSYDFWTVISSRADTSSPHIVRAWIHEKEEGRPDMEIQARLIITAESTDANPYGLFTLYFKTEMPNGTIGMKGYIRTVEQNNKIVLQFVDQSGFDFNGDGVNDEAFAEASSLEKNSTGTSGGGSISKSGTHTNPTTGQSMSEDKAFNMAFNENYFYRAESDDSSTAVCLDRNNPTVNAWRYNLYNDENHATDPGGRVTRTSGFPIEYTATGGGEGHGYVSYWGLWAPDGTLSNGDTVTRQVFGGTGTDYTVFISQGKLTKNTKQTITLGDLKGVPIEFGMQDDSVSPPTWKQFQVTWNATTQKLMKTATLNQTNWQWNEIAEADQTEVDFSSSWMRSLDFWSRALGGSGRIELKDETNQFITLSNSTPVVFHLQSMVYPSDTIPATLACFNDCLDPSNLSGASPYIAGTSMGGGSFDWNASLEATNMNTAPSALVADTNYYAYTFDTTNYVLKRGGTSLVMPSNSQSTFGMRSGALVDPSILDDLDSNGKPIMACDWNPNSTCGWNIWNLSEYYTWESGLEDWQHFSALKDSNGAFLKFDPPLAVKYTHTTGAKFFLEYGGAGDLWGIPGKCVNMDTGADVSCWEEGQTVFPKWVPQFSIADGSTVIGINPDTGAEVTYYVKALEKEEVMTAVAASTCSAAGLTLTAYALPDIADWIDPDIGTEPTITDAPAVVGGVVQ